MPAHSRVTTWLTARRACNSDGGDPYGVADPPPNGDRITFGSQLRHVEVDQEVVRAERGERSR